MVPRFAQVAIASMLVATGLFFTVMGAVQYLHGRALAARGTVIDATVTATPNREQDSDTGHQVRYRFQVGDHQFERVGVFGTGVDSDVTAEDQAQAAASGHVSVRYLPDDPNVNEPVAHAR